MNAETCISAIKASKKHNFICDETIAGLVEREIAKYKSEKDVIKSVKTKLHQITGAFIDESDIKKAYGILQKAYGILRKICGNLENTDGNLQKACSNLESTDDNLQNNYSLPQNAYGFSQKGYDIHQNTYDILQSSHDLSEATDRQSMGEDIRSILSLHASTRERMDFMEEMFKDIFTVTGRNCSILDIACGFNPFFLALYSESDREKYYASDINVKLIDLLNYFFSVSNINGHAFASDILYKIPDVQVQNVFLFKIIPLLEQQQKGYSKVLARRLKSEFFTITFPTRSLSGKNVGMYRFYNELMHNYFTGDEFEYCLQKEYFNEALYIIRRRK